MWLEKTITLYRDFVESWEKDNNISDYQEALMSLPVFSLRWLYCMYKLGKNDTDCAVEYLKEIEPFLKQAEQNTIDSVILSAHKYLENGEIADINKYIEKYIKK